MALGTLSGSIVVDGAPAHDGTTVTAAPTLASTAALVQDNTQAVLISSGRHMLWTVGTRCKDQPAQFSQLTVAVVGMGGGETGPGDS